MQIMIRLKRGPSLLLTRWQVSRIEGLDILQDICSNEQGVLVVVVLLRWQFIFAN